MKYLHQSLEDIINASDSAQRILWNEIFLKFGERIAVTPEIYSGILAGAELQTYTARKIHFAYQVSFGMVNATAASHPYIQFMDENNAQHFISFNNSLVWNVTGAVINYDANNYVEKNIWFSHVNNDQYTQIRFIGYRITF